jgi:hypothetical protein
VITGRFAAHAIRRCEVEPYYNNRGGAYKATESRGTEAVLNAFILPTRRSKRPTR